LKSLILFCWRALSKGYMTKPLSSFCPYWTYFEDADVHFVRFLTTHIGFPSLPSIVVSLAAVAGWVATDPFHDFPD